MKLDFETGAAETAFLNNTADEFTGDNDFSSDAAADKLLQSGIEAARAGERTRARVLLVRATQIEPASESAWMWLASVSEYPEELLVFLDRVLSINPRNERALQWARETKSMMSKTFVERGVGAASENQNDFARQCFRQAILQDDENETAWLHLALLPDTDEEKPAHLQKVLSLNTENELPSYYEIEDDVLSFNDSAEKAASDDYFAEPDKQIVAEEEELFTENPLSSEIENDAASKENNGSFDFSAEESAEEDEKSEQTDFPTSNAQKTFACPFCSRENEPQTLVCPSCEAMLSLSELEILLAHDGANREIVRQAVGRAEMEKEMRDLSADELKFMGVGQINLKLFREGLASLRQAVKTNPNDVVLGAQVNSLAIRLAEIEEQDAIHSSMSKNKTILVVDDSATVRKLISGKLEKSGHVVLCAVDGMDALEKIEASVPDLILLDITMPRMDGYQVCKLIRANEKTRDVPIVMISGKDGFFDKVRGRIAGTTGYITKPFGPETLMKTVENYIV